MSFMRHLGIDYGTGKIGIALSDEGGSMGFPHGIIANTADALDELASLIAEKDVGVVVMGESRSLGGAENPVAKEARTFGDRLSERTGVPVVYESEVYTSAEARRAPGKEPKSRAPKKKGNVDASAAALILTSYLSKSEHE